MERLSKNLALLKITKESLRVIRKNTGGMGAYSPSRLENNKLNQKIISKIIEPTLQGLDDLGVSFKGFLYAGLMINNDEPYLIEYNVRM